MSSRSDLSERKTRSTRSQSKSTPQKRESSPSSQSSHSRSSRRRQPPSEINQLPETNRSTRSLRSNENRDPSLNSDQIQDQSERQSTADVNGSQPHSQTRSETPIRGSVGLLRDQINLSSPLHYGSTEFGHSSVSSVRSGSRNAVKKRFDISSDSRTVRQINVGETEAPAEEGVPVATSESHSSSVPQLVIWGTDVAINQCKEKFKQFLKSKGLNANDLDSDEREADIPMDTELII